MELREILILLALLVIVLVVADGVRRLRKRQAPAPAPVARQAPVVRGDEPDFNPELPTGGARVIRRQRLAPSVGDAGGVRGTSVADDPAVSTTTPRKVEQVDMFGDVEIPAAQPAPAREIRERGQMPRRAAEPGRDPGVSLPRSEPSPKPKRQAPEDVIVLHVMGGAQRLPGNTLMQAALDCGMRWGDYRIFHRYESSAHDALAMFSMASAVEPGTFDIDTMETQSFVGVSFFLMLPGPGNGRQALDMMIEAARRVARDTGGELHDQQHSVLTPQTVEHLRQRVMEFERRRLAQQRGGG